MMRVKNHQTPATRRVDVVFGEISDPGVLGIEKTSADVNDINK